MDFIRIRGARTHNLQNISLDLPHYKFIVIAGLSGSGKSSLAFSTLYAEGQRRYMESISTCTRQFLQRVEKPNVDLIDGLFPAIAIQQKTVDHHSHSTVSTITGIHDYLRLLYARIGIPHCPNHRVPIQTQSIRYMMRDILAWPSGTRLAILAPIARSYEGTFEKECADLRSQGYVRLRVNKDFLELRDLTSLPESQKYSIDIVVDRLRIQPNISRRLSESFEAALELGNGRTIVVNLDTDQEEMFSRRNTCRFCDYTPPDLEPGLFSFNTSNGACRNCKGTGIVDHFDPKLLVNFPKLSLKEGAISSLHLMSSSTWEPLTNLIQSHQFNLSTPFIDLPFVLRKQILFGSGAEETSPDHLDKKVRRIEREKLFEGIIPTLERYFHGTKSFAMREQLKKIRSSTECFECCGSRLCLDAQHVLIVNPQNRDNTKSQGYAIHELESIPLTSCSDWFHGLACSSKNLEVIQHIVPEIQNRLTFLNDMGLGYLSLNRRISSVSRGEAQRIRLAGKINLGLRGMMYVLDEPSIGLHQYDSDKIVKTLHILRDEGNTVIVVEHDENIIRSSDWVVDMGPNAGKYGGKVVALGTPKSIQKNSCSLTGQYLSGMRSVQIPENRPIDSKSLWLTLKGASGNNLRSVNLNIPIGKLTCVSGVSGSGKSTLIVNTLFAALNRKLHHSQCTSGPYLELFGSENFNKVININQAHPMGRSSRSNPATYTGIFSSIREIFASTPQARSRGYDSSRFSFNLKGGRCEACEGEGITKITLNFLPDIYAKCGLCNGKRYNDETLKVYYRNRNISEVLELSVVKAREYFSSIPIISRKLDALIDVGLSYLCLGQSATTFSSGEAQRIRLANELSCCNTGKTLYILDEPTIGLHFQDVQLLLSIVNRLVRLGNTVIIIEHNLDVIKAADWLIDMGPEGGTKGGHIVAEGTPSQIANMPTGYTSYYLAKSLKDIQTVS